MPNDKFSTAIKEAREHLEKNQFSAAENLVNSLVERWPTNSEVHNLAGVLNFKMGAYEKAATAFNQYLLLDPNNIPVLNNLAVTYRKTQNYTEARSTLKKAIKLDKRHVNSYINLMSIELNQKNYETIIKIFDEAKKLPSGLDCNLIAASAYKALGKPQESKILLKSYLAFHKSDMNALNNLGNIELEEGNLIEAKRIFENVLHQYPKFLEAKLNLAVTLDALDEFKQAEKLLLDLSEKNKSIIGEVTLSKIYYRRGLHEIAIPRLKNLLPRKQSEGEVHHEIGIHLYKIKDYTSAIIHLNQASVFGYVIDQSWNVKALCEEALGNYKESINILEKYLDENPNSCAALSNLGRIYIALCDPKQGLKYIREAYWQEPSRSSAYSNFLFNLHYDPAILPADIYENSVKVGKTISGKAVNKYNSWPCMEVDDAITLAFFSPDFNNHPVGLLIENVLAELKTKSVRLVAISGSVKEDDQTEKLRDIFDQWINVKGLRPDAAAEKVYNTKPHGLIDLAGYTDGGLMEMFAYKCAPVQIEWLGYLSTTGLPEMDYFLVDETTPQECNHLFSEKLIRLKGCHLNYYIPDYKIEVGHPPVVNNSYITFGSFNNISKINHKVLDIWSEILLKLENSVLRIQAKNTDKVFIQDTLYKKFESRGISTDRIEIVPPSRGKAYLESYRELDICLDTFPYTGGKITLDSLFMGVPVVTLKGKSHFSNNSASILNTIGHSELIAQDLHEYIDLTLELCNNRELLLNLSKSLRQSFLSSFSKNPSVISDALLETVLDEIELIQVSH